MLNEAQAMEFLSGTPTGWDYFDTDWDNINPLDFRYLQIIAWAYEERSIAAQGSNRTGSHKYDLSPNLSSLANANVYLTVPSCFSLGGIIDDIVNLGKFYINYLYTDYSREISHYLDRFDYTFRYVTFPKVFQKNWIYEHFPEIAKWHSLLLASSSIRSSNYFKNDFIGLFREMKELLCLYKYVVPFKIYTDFSKNGIGGRYDYDDRSYGTEYWGHGLSASYNDAFTMDAWSESEGIKRLFISDYWTNNDEYVIENHDRMERTYLLGFLGYNDFREERNIQDIGYTWDYGWTVVLGTVGWKNCKIFKYLPVNCNYTRFTYTYDFDGVISNLSANMIYTGNTYGLPVGFGITDLGAWSEDHKDFTVLDKSTIQFHDVPRADYDGPLVPTPGTHPEEYRVPTKVNYVIDGCGCLWFFALNYAVPSGFVFQ